MNTRGLLHKTFYRRKLWLKLKTQVSTILPLTLTQEKTQVKNNLSFLRLRVLCNRPLNCFIVGKCMYFLQIFIKKMKKGRGDRDWSRQAGK